MFDLLVSPFFDSQGGQIKVRFGGTLRVRPTPEDAIKGIVSKEAQAKVLPVKRSYAMGSLRSVTDMWFEHAKQINYYKEECYRQKEYHRFNKNILSVIGSVPVDSLTLDDVSMTFRPLWKHAATCMRLLGILRNVIRFAIRKKLTSLDKVYICDKNNSTTSSEKTLSKNILNQHYHQSAFPPL